MLIAYASRTGTVRNLNALREAGWRLLVSATGELRPEGFRYAIDNGAWTAFQQKQPFDEAAFVLALRTLGAGADWTVVPDIVAGGLRSLEFSASWLPRVLDACPRALLAVQDGMQPADVAPFINDTRMGLFVGGSTEWKLATMGQWAAMARERRAVCHVGRVNTRRRILMCARAGVTSFDGTSATVYASTLPLLDGARRLDPPPSKLKRAHRWPLWSET